MGIFSVANAVKVTQACIYKSASAGLLLASIVTTSIVKFNMLMLVFTF